MQPKLIAITGPLAGSSFTLPEKEGCVGRAPYNWLTIPSSTISRQHFQFELSHDGWKIVDLESHNGTFVNDMAIKERVLVNRDHVRAGDSHFVFVTEEEDLPHAAPEEDESTQHTRTLYTRSSESTLLLPPPEQAPQAQKQLASLLRLSAAIQTARDLDSLRGQLTTAVQEMFRARQVCVYWRDAAGFERLLGAAPLAGALIEPVWKEGKALLGESEESHWMAAPMTVAGTVKGALYLEGASFQAEQLDFVAAVAAFVALAIEHVLALDSLRADNQRLQEEAGFAHEMVGESRLMRRVYETIRRVAPSDTTVLILGDNGTGKELAARAVHRNSPRRDKPFLAINCATLKETLLESELFGHEKGAFTGAVAQKKGRIELAEGGTLFLDEIGEMDPGLQARLLRVLQEREFERLGGIVTIKADVRVLAATNRDLSEDVREGRFRPDLFYRLNVVPVRMPSLRDRREDIPLLAAHFLAQYTHQCNRAVEGISDEARELLVRHDWPGNVRELQNTIERAVVLGSSRMIELEDLPDALLDAPVTAQGQLPAYHQALQDTKRKQILDAIAQASGNISEAARRLGVNPNYLHRLVTKLGLRGEISRP